MSVPNFANRILCPSHGLALPSRRRGNLGRTEQHTRFVAVVLILVLVRERRHAFIFGSMAVGMSRLEGGPWLSSERGRKIPVVALVAGRSALLGGQRRLAPGGLSPSWSLGSSPLSPLSLPSFSLPLSLFRCLSSPL